MGMDIEESARYQQLVKRWEESKTAERLRIQEQMLAPERRAKVVEYAPVERTGPRCRVLLSDSSQCESPAIDGFDECIRHARWNTLVPVQAGLPYPEDAVALQEFMARAVSMLLSKRMTAQEAQAVASLCALMLKNLPRCEMELKSRF
jgi:hypothetical protein